MIVSFFSDIGDLADSVLYNMYVDGKLVVIVPHEEDIEWVRTEITSGVYADTESLKLKREFLAKNIVIIPVSIDTSRICGLRPVLTCIYSNWRMKDRNKLKDILRGFRAVSSDPIRNIKNHNSNND